MPKRPYKRWNADEALRVLKQLKAKGERLNSGHIARTRPALAYAVRKYVGSWESAITAIGLDYDQVRRKSFWSKKRIVARILELKRAGKPLNMGTAELNYGGLVGAASVYFGSWGAAIRAAGLDYLKIKKQKEWSQAAIVSEIKRMQRAGLDLSTTIPVRAKYRILHAAAIRYFGSWAAAMKAAKLEKLLR